MSAKDDIISAITKTEDANMKAVLILLYGVLEEISSKIDSMAADEKGLRAAVLNGHEPVHHDHHEWVARQLKYDESNTEHHKWVAKKMIEEEEDAKAAKESKRAIRNNLIERAIWVVISILAGAGWLMK